MLQQLGKQLHGCEQLHTLYLEKVQSFHPDGSVSEILPDELVTAIGTLKSLSYLVVKSEWDKPCLSPAQCDILCRGLFQLNNLDFLDLSSNSLGEHVQYITQAINAWQQKPHLRILNLTRCKLSSTVAGRLLKALADRCHMLYILYLAINDLGGQIAALTSQTLPHLRYLYLHRCNLQSADGHALATAIQLKNLPQLQDVTVGSLCTESIAAILRAALCHHRRELSIRIDGCEVSMAPLQPYLCTVTSTDTGVMLQALAIGCSRLKTIELTDHDLAAQISALTLQKSPLLRKLQFRNCNLQQADGYALAAAIQEDRLPQLEELYFSDNPSLDDEGVAAALCTALVHHNGSKSLKLDHYLSMGYSCVALQRGALKLENHGLCYTVRGVVQALSTSGHQLMEIDLSYNDLGGQIKKITSKTQHFIAFL